MCAGTLVLDGQYRRMTSCTLTFGLSLDCALTGDTINLGSYAFCFRWGGFQLIVNESEGLPVHLISKKHSTQ